MPLEPQNIEILFGSLQQKTSDKVIKAGDLTRAQNVEFDKGGQLNKRRGYRRYTFTGAAQIAAFDTTMETQALRVCTFQDELLLFGVSWLWSVASKTASIDGRAAVRRGRLNPGNTRRRRIFTSSEGSP